MLKNLKKRIAKATLSLLVLQLCLVGVGSGATGAYASTGFAGTVESFSLYNATTNELIGVIKAGAKINMADPTIGTNLNIVANVLPEVVDSVSFKLSGAESFTHTEGVAPYALKGDSPAGVFNDWTPTVGNYTLEATPWEGGVAGVTAYINFSVFNDDESPEIGDSLVGTYVLNEGVVSSYNPLQVAVEYSEIMDVNVDPILTFSEDISESVICDGKWDDGDSYTFTCVLTDADVEMSGITATITGAEDLAGNKQLEFAPTAELVIDTKAPVATLKAASPTNKKTIPVSLSFSEEVVGMDLAKLSVINGSAQNLVGGPSLYTFEVVPTVLTAAAEITVSLAEGEVVDVNGNENNAEELVIKFDPTAPAAVTGVTTLTDASGHVTVSWVNPVAGSYSTLRIVRVGDFVATLNLSANSYLDMTTERGKTYQYVIVVGDEAGNETSTPQVTVTVPALGVASVVSDTYSYDLEVEDEEEVKAETVEEDLLEEDDNEDEDSDGFPTWGLLILVMLAAVGGYLIWNQQPAPVVAPVEESKKKNNTNTKKK